VPEPCTFMTDFTIAVLPFENFSADKENDYFSDGITEEIINALAKIRELKVTSRTSSFFYKGKNKPIKEIGEALKVSTILEGSVRLAEKQVRITAQLIDVAEDYHFWSETWDKSLDNIFEIQDEVSLLIADKLREQLGHFTIQDHLVEKQTDSLDAYSCSLEGKYLRNNWNPEDVRKAIGLFEKALELDPEHDESYVGLADCYSFLGTTGFMPFDEAWKLTIKYTRKALELNSESSGAYYQLSNYSFFVEANYGKSLGEMIKAVELNPNNADAHEFLSFMYIIAKDRKKALEHLEIALSLNPLSEQSKFFKGYYYYMIEDFPEALNLFNSCLAVNDKNLPAHAIKTLCLLKMGRYDEVISYFDNVPPNVVNEGEKTGVITLAYALKKDETNLASCVTKLKKMAGEPYGQTADSFMFTLSAVQGDADRAFEWVVNAIDNSSLPPAAEIHRSPGGTHYP
jgi:adenylate cyclase